MDNLRIDSLRIDSQKLVFHPRRVAQWLEGKDEWETAKKIYPLYLELSPIGGCNHSCLMCGVDYVIEGAKQGRIPQLDTGMLGERLLEMGQLGVKSIMYAGAGEPMLHKRINVIVAQTRAAGIDVAFTTNGVLLDRLWALRECTWVKVSVNAGTKQTYAKVHRTKEEDWDRTWANIADAVKRKGNCMIGVQMVLLPENQHEVDDFHHMVESVGADYGVVKSFSQHKFSINRQYENFIPIVPESKGRVVVRKDSMQTQEIPYDKCQATPYLWGYVEANGDVYSCSAYLLDDRFNLGNLNTHTFREVWEGEKRRRNWEFVRNELDIHDCRVNCRMNSSNIYLNDLVKGVPGRNFV